MAPRDVSKIMLRGEGNESEKTGATNDNVFWGKYER